MMKRSLAVTATVALMTTAATAQNSFIALLPPSVDATTAQGMIVSTPDCADVVVSPVATIGEQNLVFASNVTPECQAAIPAGINDLIVAAAPYIDCVDNAGGWVAGASALCPLDAGDNCTADQFCDGPGNDPAVACPSEGVCPSDDPAVPAVPVAYSVVDAADTIECPDQAGVTIHEFTSNQDGTRFVTFEGTQTDVDACVAVLGSRIAVASGANDCFDPSFVPVPGAAADCPLDWEATCTPGTYCRGEAAAAQCPAEGKCPAKADPDVDVISAAYKLTQDFSEDAPPGCQGVQVVRVADHQTAGSPPGFAIFKGTQANIDACVALIGAELYPAADACFKSDGTGNLGGAAVCPFNWGAACTASDTYCRGETAADKCPADGKCPAFVPVWAHVMKSVVKREWHWNDPKNDNPAWTLALGAALAKAQTAEAAKYSQCQNAPGQASGTFVTSKNGRDTMTIAPTAEATPCDFKWWGGIHNDAAKAFNTDLDKEKQVHTKWSFESFGKGAYEACVPATGAQLLCKLQKEGCTIKCHDGVENCTKNDDCGGFCEQPPKEEDSGNVTPQQVTVPTCASDAWVAIAAPVVAAVFALALF